MLIGLLSNDHVTLGCGLALNGTSKATESPSFKLIVSSYFVVVMVGGAVNTHNFDFYRIMKKVDLYAYNIVYSSYVQSPGQQMVFYAKTNHNFFYIAPNF